MFPTGKVQERPDDTSAMRICFLGTGGSWPTRDRNVASISLSHGKRTLLLDCGEGTQRQIMGSPVSPMRIDAILISHLHGDHFLGLPGLVQTMSLNNRDRPLTILGPEGTAQSVARALTSTVFDPGYDVDVTEMVGGDHFMVGDLKVTCAEASHGITDLAFRIETPIRPGRFHREKAISLGVPEGHLWGRLQKGEPVTFRIGGKDRTVMPEDVLGGPRKGIAIVYSGDTAPCETVKDLACGADALIHESTYSLRFKEMAEQYGHSTSRGAAETARDAGVKRLFLIHTSPRYADPSLMDELIREAREVFPGALVPSDLECFEVNP